MRYEQKVALALAKLKVSIVTPEVRRFAIDSFVMSRQASCNYGLQCSHLDVMKGKAPAFEWKITSALGEESMLVDLGDNGTIHPPMIGMLIENT